MGFKYDVAVLGGGPGGYAAALRLCNNGLKVALIEESNLGGVCLNRGCIPTKAMLHCAELAEISKKLATNGIFTSVPSVDFAGVAKYRDDTVAKLRNGLQNRITRSGTDVVSTHGTLLDCNTIKVNGVKITAQDIIIATGSSPYIPPIPGITGNKVVTSDGILALSELPKQLVIVGAGVIGVEFAASFASFGSKVTLLSSYDRVLRRLDRDMSALCKAYLEKLGINVEVSTNVTDFYENENGITCIYNQNGEKKSVSADLCTVTAGRRPNISDTGILDIGIITENGAVKTDRYMRTNINNIYAVGDVTGKGNLAHLATAQGLVAADCILGKDRKISYRTVPNFVGTNPELASVGFTEEDAKKAGLDIAVGYATLSGNGKSAAAFGGEGFCKLIADRVTGELYGCHMVCPHASDLIGTICSVIECEGTVFELSKTIFPHPTFSEIIFDAAINFEKAIKK